MNTTNKKMENVSQTLSVGLKTETNRNQNPNNGESKMTRQQRRKMERDMMKEENRLNKGVEPVQLHSFSELPDILQFGFFYKGDKDDGIFLVVEHTDPELLQFMLKMYEQVQQSFDKHHHLMSVSQVITNLQKGISFWNEYQEYHDKNYKINHIRRVDMGDEKLIECLLVIMYGVYHLVQLGVIRDDNHNGFYFLRSYKNVG